MANITSQQLYDAGIQLARGGDLVRAEQYLVASMQRPIRTNPPDPTRSPGLAAVRSQSASCGFGCSLRLPWKCIASAACDATSVFASGASPRGAEAEGGAGCGAVAARWFVL